MALLDITHGNSGLADRFGVLVARARAAHARRALYRNTVRELNALGDRDLADLGLSRGMIESVAREAVAGARG